MHLRNDLNLTSRETSSQKAKCTTSTHPRIHHKTDCQGLSYGHLKDRRLVGGGDEEETRRMGELGWCLASVFSWAKFFFFCVFPFGKPRKSKNEVQFTMLDVV